MKKCFLSIVAVAISLFSLPAFSQSEKEKTSAEKDSALKKLPGANLDLYAVMDLFQKSKTIEEFEKNLNLEKTGINNLDLDLDKKVDFIKVVTTKKDDDFTFVLQVAVSKTETQDVAVILVSKDKDKKISMQIVGDKDLYGKDFIVEPKESTTPSKTPNPAYTGENPDTVYVPAKTTTVVVEQAPIVQYVYSPAYVPYVPPYYYGYYPPYYAAFTVMAVGMYWGACAHYHGGYGYHGNTTVIHNTNNFNNYNGNRNTSGTVDRNRQNGNYDRGNNAANTRPSNGAGGGNRPSQGAGGGARPSTQPSGGAGGAGGGARPSTQPSGGRGSEMGGGGARPSTQPSNSFSGSSSRPSTQPSNNRSSGGSNYNSGGSSRGSGGYSGGGGSRGGGGGGSRGGGGGRGGGGRR